MDTECIHVAPPPQMDKYDEENINELELWAVMAFLTRWYHVLKNETLMLYTDNMQVYHMILSGRSINKTCMRWIQELFWTCVVNNIYIVSMYVPTADNVVADTLSRLAYPVTRRNLRCYWMVWICVVKVSYWTLADPTLRVLERENEKLKRESVAQSTMRNRKIQWRCYLRFCANYNFDPYPCSVPQAGLYATYLSQYMLHSSITTYILAVVFFHNINGYIPPRMGDHRPL